MRLRHSTVFCTLFLVLGLTMAWGCGGGGGYNPDPDAMTDGVDDTTGDVVTDGDDDAPADAPSDTPGDVPTDVDDDDGGGPSRTYRPFHATTSGGVKASSTHYELEIFVAPTMPVGSGSSTNYNIKVGPAGVRSN